MTAATSRWQRSTVASRLCRGALATRTRCTAIRRRSPTMPRASRSGWLPSRVMVTGRACRISTPSTRACARAWASACATSAGPTARPPSSTSTVVISDSGRAARDADHDLLDGASGLLLGLVDHRQNRRFRRLGVDDLTRPQPFGELVAAAHEVEPAVAAARDQAAHLAGADVEHRDRLGAPQGARLHPRQRDDVARAHASLSSSAAGSRRRRSRSGRKRRSIRVIARSSNAVVARLLREQAPGAEHIALRQPHLDLVVEMQGPAALADPGGGDHAVRQGRLGRQQREQAGGRLRGIVADQDPQVLILLGMVAQGVLDHDALPVDHLEPPVPLPQGERLPLEQPDLDGIGQHAGDARLLDPAELPRAAAWSGRDRPPGSACRSRCRARLRRTSCGVRRRPST